MAAVPATADSVDLRWPAAADGSVYITYSYSNLLDGHFLLITPEELRAATEEGLGLWAAFAPIHFVEVPDSGPVPSDTPYEDAGGPVIRLGYHVTTDLAHAYFPGDDGLAGDVHVAGGIPWTVDGGRWNFLEAVTHELGHALGLPHEYDAAAIMNPFYPSQRFGALGSGFLFPADIAALQRLYGAGVGSVDPLTPTPEPELWFLVALILCMLVAARRRSRKVATIVSVGCVIVLACTGAAIAEPITISSGTFRMTGTSGSLAINGSDGFSLVARVSGSEGIFAPRDTCHFFPVCIPGSSIDLNAYFLGVAVVGTATLNGTTYPAVGSLASDNSAQLRFSGSALAPSFDLGNTATLTAPFTFLGTFYFLGGSRDLVGSGQTTLVLRQGFGPGEGLPPAWTLVSAAYDFSPTPEPATIFLTGAGLAAMARMRRRKSL